MPSFAFALSGLAVAFVTGSAVFSATVSAGVSGFFSVTSGLAPDAFTFSDSGFVGLVAGPRPALVHIHLVLEDGRDMYLPVADMAYRNLCRVFADQHKLNESS